MTTRTFNTPEEFMISLLQGEKWSLAGNRAVFLYNKKYPVTPFRAMDSSGNSEAIEKSYNYCDGKTLWHKVEEKTELDLMKEKFASGDYICISHVSDKWKTNKRPAFIEIGSYKLIHKKHKDVLDTYLADNSVDIEVCGTYYGAEYTDLFEIGESDFIDSYNENWEYRIKPKKKTVTIIKFYSSKGKILEMDKSKLTQMPKNIINEYEIEVYDE